MKKNYNVLVIGAGKIGFIRAKVVRKLNPKSKLFIFDTNRKKSHTLAKEVNGNTVRSLQEGLKNKDIDIVVISVINRYSKDISIKALRNKKHVLCEKPMGTHYNEALTIFNTVKKYKTIFKCGFNHRYHPGIMHAYRLVKKGFIGRILYIRGVYGHGGREGYEKEWRAKKKLSGGGELIDQGSHLVDLCHWFFNFEKIKKSFCITKTMYWKMNVDDNAFIILETKKGKVAGLHVSWTQWKNLFRFEVYGTEGAIEVNGLGKSYGIETIKIHKKTKHGMSPKITEVKYKTRDKSWELEWLDFIRSIRQNKLPNSNHIESLSVMKTISTLYGTENK